ncbi:MAG: SipW-dependent-type signal peptide-containing protein [Candidatus Coproplasma sp.]
MKATKKIVGAACALVAAVALSAGSTFAWFTSNEDVSATGLQIDVHTDNAYLIIGTSTSDLANGKDNITLNPTNNNTKLLPSAYKVYDNSEPAQLVDPTKEGGTASGPSIVTESTWYTAQGTNSDNGAINAETKEALTASTFSKYVVVADMCISVSVGSIAVSNVNATMTPTFDDSKDVPINVVFLYQTVAPKKQGETTTWGDLGDWTKVEVSAVDGLGINGVDLGGITNSNYYIAVKVMVYLDGNNADVKTTNSANLSGVGLKFDFAQKTAQSS